MPHSVVKISCVIWPPCLDNITMYMVTLGRAQEGISHKQVGLPEQGAIQVGCIQQAHKDTNAEGHPGWRGKGCYIQSGLQYMLSIKSTMNGWACKACRGA